MTTGMIQTPHLVLKPIVAGDLVRLHELHTDPFIVDSLYQGVAPDMADTSRRLAGFVEDWARHGFGFYTLWRRDDQQFVGRRGLRFLDGGDALELGACLHGAFAGHGYGPESGLAVLGFAFSHLGAGRVSTLVRPDNHRSLRAIEKMGFAFARDYHRGDRSFLLFEVTAAEAEAAAARNGVMRAAFEAGGSPAD